MNWICKFPFYLLCLADLTPGTNCPPDYQKYGNNCEHKCVREIRDKLERSEGEHRCRQDGGQLLSLHEEADTDVLLNNLMLTTSRVWMGMDYAQSSWRWSDGLIVEWTNWNEGEPDVQEQACAVNDGRWTTESCTKDRYVICQWDPSPILGYTCPVNYAKYENLTSCLRILSYEVSKVEGEAICNEDEGHLLFIKSQNENDAVDGLSQVLADFYWIGLNDNDIGMSWTDNSAVTWTNWRPGEPNKNEHQCVVTNRKWRDRDCTQLNMVLCQWTNGSEPAIPCHMSSFEGVIETVAQTTAFATDAPAINDAAILTSEVPSAKNNETTKSVSEISTATRNTQTTRSVIRSSQASREISTIKIIKFAPKTHEAAGAAAMGTLVFIIVSIFLGCIAFSDLPLFHKHFGIMLVNLRILKRHVHRK